MPYKTPFGSHYHLKVGCNGAFIPCGTSGLVPCSVCCGLGSKGADGGEAGTGTVGSGVVGQSEKPTKSLDEHPREDLQQDSMRHQQALPPSLRSHPAPSADAHEIPDLATRYAEIRKRFKGTVPPVTSGFETNPSSNSETGTHDSQKDAPEQLARRFSAAHSSEELAHDDNGNIRFELIREIDEHVGGLEFRFERIAFLRKVQREWNEMHPEAPILEWSEKDDWYVSNSARGVLYAKHIKPLNERSNDTIIYSILDKVTGQDVVPLVHHYDYKMRQLKNQMEAIENEAHLRIRLEINYNEGVDEAFAQWRRNKGNHSSARRYKDDLVTLDIRELSRLQREFKRDMPEYDIPALTPEERRARYSSQEQSDLRYLHLQYAEMEANLSQAIRDYSISPERIRQLRYQHYVYEDGEYQGESDPLA